MKIIELTRLQQSPYWVPHRLVTFGNKTTAVWHTLLMDRPKNGMHSYHISEWPTADDFLVHCDTKFDTTDWFHHATLLAPWLLRCTNNKTSTFPGLPVIPNPKNARVANYSIDNKFFSGYIGWEKNTLREEYWWLRRTSSSFRSRIRTQPRIPHNILNPPLHYFLQDTSLWFKPLHFWHIPGILNANKPEKDQSCEFMSKTT